MKILYLLPGIQHPTMRGALRHYHFLRTLAERHAVTVLALSRGEVTREAREELGSLVERLLIFPADGDHPGARGRSALRNRIQRELRVQLAVREMRRTLQALVARERFNVVLFHGKIIAPAISGLRDLPIVVDFCDATSIRLREGLRFSKRWEVPLRWLRLAQVLRVEGRLVGLTPFPIFISPRDREAVLGPGGTTPVIPNGIDLSYWTRGTRSAQANCLVFTGVMDYAPNEDAALFLIRELLPRLRAVRPEVELLIVGRDPTPTLVEAGRQPGVIVTGFVEDVRPYLERAAMFVAPIRYASGLQNKILEALAMEVPVVTTPVVAAGLRLDDGVPPPVEVAEGAEALATRILALLADDEGRRRLAEEGRRFIETRFDWRRGGERLEALCLMAARRGTSTYGEEA